MEKDIKEIVVVGHSLLETTLPSAEYYIEQLGMRQIAQQAGVGVQRAVVGSLRYVVKRVIAELEECASGREWVAELTLDIGIGPELAHTAGKLTITIKGRPG